MQIQQINALTQIALHYLQDNTVLNTVFDFFWATLNAIGCILFQKIKKEMLILNFRSSSSSSFDNAAVVKKKCLGAPDVVINNHLGKMTLAFSILSLLYHISFDCRYLMYKGGERAKNIRSFPV